jgi:hypothetical protein
MVARTQQITAGQFVLAEGVLIAGTILVRRKAVQLRDLGGVLDKYAYDFPSADTTQTRKQHEAATRQYTEAIRLDYASWLPIIVAIMLAWVWLGRKPVNVARPRA